MQDFKEECSSNLRQRLSDAERSIKEKHSFDLSSVSKQYDSHIKSNTIDIREHEKIVIKEIESLNSSHK